MSESAYRSTIGSVQVLQVLRALFTAWIILYRSELVSKLFHIISRLLGSFPPPKYCSLPQQTIGMPIEVRLSTIYARQSAFFILQSWLPVASLLRVLALSWLSAKLASRLNLQSSSLLRHSEQNSLTLVMSLLLKKVSFIQKQKGQFSTPSTFPTQPARQSMLPLKTSPTVYTLELWVNSLQKSLGTSGTVSILKPSIWYFQTSSLIQSSSFPRTQLFSCLMSASPASLQFQMRFWFKVLKSWSLMMQQSWQWSRELKGLFWEQSQLVLPMWLPTTSTITQMPLLWQAYTNARKSSSDPKLLLSRQRSLPQQPWYPPSQLSTIGLIQMASKPIPWIQSSRSIMALQLPPQQNPRLLQLPPPCLLNLSVRTWQMVLERH